jgi:glutamyl-Q tRNA(Asp) synthetase
VTLRTRFAPSPTGPLHLGHAYSALLAYDMAVESGGDFMLRIEDIDQSRARDTWEQNIYQDLEWLGLRWSGSVVRQSDRLDVYRAALDNMWQRDLLYPCSCSRRDITQALSAPQEGVPHYGPDGVIYPGTCRATQSAAQHHIPHDTALRLNMSEAVKGHTLQNTGFRFQETGYCAAGGNQAVEFSASHLVESVGDIVLARKDMGTSYHLSVVLDDAAQGITHVVRGHDLFDATKIHVVLQNVLEIPTPVYHHHDLIRDDTGKRLAKRDDARAISKFRNDGYTPEDILKIVGLKA